MDAQARGNKEDHVNKFFLEKKMHDVNTAYTLLHSKHSGKKK